MVIKEAIVERIDHLGIIAGVIEDLKIVERIDERIGKNSKEEITTGEAVAGMIINGLGFSDRPLSLTPQFFENKALEKLFRKEVLAKHFNRFKLGRSLDDCHAYGCDLLFSELSIDICKQEGVDTRFNALDTTTFSLTGEYDCDSDEHTIAITHGYSKDHRPDLKQALLELICTHDGGIPVISKSWDGNTSDTEIFRKRAKELMQNFKSGETPRYLIADAKLYDQKSIDQYLKNIPFITRIPGTIKEVSNYIYQALDCPFDMWEIVDEKNQCLSFEVKHYGINQRWIVIYSKEAQKRATSSIEKKCQKEKEVIDKQLKKLCSQEYSCRKDAIKGLKAFGKKWRFHSLSKEEIKETKKYIGKGRPSSSTPFEVCYHVEGEMIVDLKKKDSAIKEGSCFVLGTTISIKELSCVEVIEAYKKQNDSVERGFKFLKDPYLFTSSLFVKKPSRIMGLLMVMTLALLVYSIAQRRLRAALKKAGETLPNQIKKEINTPTLRWIFQLLGGIEKITFKTGEVIGEVITGLTDLKKRILSYFGSSVQKIYEIDFQPAPGF